MLLQFYHPGAFSDAAVSALTKVATALRGAALFTSINCVAEAAVCEAYGIPQNPILRLLHPGASHDLPAGVSGSQIFDAVASVLRQNSRVRIISGAGSISQTGLDQTLHRFCGTESGVPISGSIATCVIMVSNRTEPPLFLHALSNTALSVNVTSAKSKIHRSPRAIVRLAPITYIFVSTPTHGKKETVLDNLSESAAAELLPELKGGEIKALAALPSLLIVHGDSVPAIRSGALWSTDRDVVTSLADIDSRRPIVGRRVLVRGAEDAVTHESMTYDGLLKLLHQHAASLNAGILLSLAK